jgi:hypothetical protein
VLVPALQERLRTAGRDAWLARLAGEGVSQDALVDAASVGDERHLDDAVDRHADALEAAVENGDVEETSGGLRTV